MSLIQLASAGDGRRVMTRSGAVAREDETIAFSLRRMQSYMSRGEPSEELRVQILSPRLATAFGKPGRALIANVLDYTHEILEGKRSPLHARKGLFTTIGELNTELDHQGVAYYVYGTFEWADDKKKVKKVRLDPFIILDTRVYRTDDRDISSLRVMRLRGSDLDGYNVGFTSIDHPDVLVIPTKVDEELFTGLLPTIDPNRRTRIFSVVGDDASSAWYRALRARLAEVMTTELGALVPGPLREVDPLEAHPLREAMVRAVEVHEIQHQLDFARKWKLFGIFEKVSEKTEDKYLAYGGMFEVSAHLAQMARDSITPRVTLSIVTSYAFSDECDSPDCFAALVILDELTTELGHPPDQRFGTDLDIELSAVVDRYLAITSHSTRDVQRAAHRAWERLYGARLATLQTDQLELVPGQAQTKRALSVARP